MADVIFNSFKGKIMDGSIDLDTDTIKLAMTTSSFTPDADAHEDFADVTNEVSGTGYTAGGAALASKAVTYDDTNNWGKFDADDVTWSTSTIANARWGVLYKDTGTPETSWLILAIDFGADKSTTAGDFTIAWHSTGILLLT